MDGLNYGVFPENQRGKSQVVRHRDAKFRPGGLSVAEFIFRSAVGCRKKSYVSGCRMQKK